MIFTVVKSPSDALAVTNEVYMHAKDAEKMSSDADTPFHVKASINPRVYLCKVHESVREGTVAMSRTQRSECFVFLDDVIALELFIPSANNSIVCSQLKVTVDLVDTPKYPVFVNIAQLETHLHREFEDHYLLFRQNIVTMYKGVLIRSVIKDYDVGVCDMLLCTGTPFCRLDRYTSRVGVTLASNPMLQDARYETHI